MDFLSPPERAFLDAFSHVAYINPFLPERLDFERAALGADFIEGEAVWSLPVDRPEETRKNIRLMVKRLEPLAEQLRERLTVGARRRRIGISPFTRIPPYIFFISNIRREYSKRISNPQAFRIDGASTKISWRIGPHFRAWCCFSTQYEPKHTFACFRQIRRALRRF